MSRYRRDIDEELEKEILGQFKKNKTIKHVAMMYNISFTLARQIKEGTRTPPPTPPERIFRHGAVYVVQKGKKETKEEELCTHCHTRPKAPGNHYLCSVCHSNN